MRTRDAGFTLLEAMVVVAIVAILAIVAYPLITRYMRRSKTAEVPELLSRMSEGAKAYYLRDLPDTDPPPERKFPDKVGPTPAKGSCCDTGGRCKVDQTLWQQKSWRDLNFSVDGAHYYYYSFDSSADTFTAQAEGDLDCNGTFSTFKINGFVKDNNIKTSGILEDNPTE